MVVGYCAHGTLPPMDSSRYDVWRSDLLRLLQVDTAVELQWLQWQALDERMTQDPEPREWAGRACVALLALELRKMIDLTRPTETLSLALLLQDITGNHHLASVEALKGCYRSDLQETAIMLWSKHLEAAGYHPDEQQLPLEMVGRDLDYLRSLDKDSRVVVNKTVAHRDRAVRHGELNAYVLRELWLHVRVLLHKYADLLGVSYATNVHFSPGRFLGSLNA